MTYFIALTRISLVLLVAFILSGGVVLPSLVQAAPEGEVLLAQTPRGPAPADPPGRGPAPSDPPSRGTAPGDSSDGGTIKLVNPLGNIDSLEELLAAVLRAIVRIGAMILVLVLVWVGFLFVMAQGNEEKLRTARSALMWTVIGGLILLGAEAVAQIITSTVSSIGGSS